MQAQAMNKDVITLNIIAHENGFKRYLEANHMTPHVQSVYRAIIAVWNDRSYIHEKQRFFVKKLDVFRGRIADISKCSYSTISRSLTELEAKGLIKNKIMLGQGQGVQFEVVSLEKYNGESLAPKQIPQQPKEENEPTPPPSPPAFTAEEIEAKKAIKKFFEEPPKEDIPTNSVFTAEELERLAKYANDCMKETVVALRIVLSQNGFDLSDFYQDEKDPNGVYWGYRDTVAVQNLQKVLLKKLPKTIQNDNKKLANACMEIEQWKTAWATTIVKRMKMAQDNTKQQKKLLAKFNPNMLLYEDVWKMYIKV